MGRKKTPEKQSWELSVKEISAKRDHNALERLMAMADEEIPILPNDDPEWIAGLMDDYEVARNQDGKKVLRPKLKHRIHIESEIAQYQVPKLRSTETKGQIDYNFNISFKRFDDEPAKVIDVTVKQLPHGN